MWRPVKKDPMDEDDEELDSAMMVLNKVQEKEEEKSESGNKKKLKMNVMILLNKEWDEVEEDKETTLWHDIKKCCTTVRN